MAGNIYRNPISKTVRSNPTLERAKLPNRDVVLAEVLAVEYEGPRAGYITFRSMGTENTDVTQALGGSEQGGTKTRNYAIPLLANVRVFPVIGEQVALITLGNVYYLPLNVLNNPVSNQTPSVFSSTIDGSLRDSSKISSTTKNTFQINKSKTYYITGMQAGDVVFEGRFGNSIKLGGTIKLGNDPRTLYSKSDLSENGDPIVIIRNGPASAIENIQRDAASIYMCSTQKILIDDGKNGFEGITGTWSSLNVSGQAIEIEEQGQLSNTNSSSPDGSRPGNPTPPDPTGAASTNVSTNTQVFSDPDYQQPSPSGPVELAPPSTGYLKPGNLTISKEGLKDLIKEEGSRSIVYDDKTGKPISSYSEAVGYPTIGVGHLITRNEYSKFEPYLKGNGKMTDDEIQKLLLSDLGSRIRALNNLLKADVTQNMFDALLSMMFNTGSGNRFFRRAIDLTNQKKYSEAAAIIKEGPVTSKGKVFAGLVRRRTNESNTYIA